MKLLSPLSRPISGSSASRGWLILIALLAFLAQASAGCHDPAEHGSAKPDPATSTLLPAHDQEPAGNPAGGVRVRVKLNAHTLYRGERIWAAVSVQNDSSAPLRLPKKPFDLLFRGAMALELRERNPGGVVGPPNFCYLLPLGRDDFVEIPTSGSWTFNLGVQDDAHLHPIQAGTYTLFAHVGHDGKCVSSPPVKFVVQELPNVDAFRKVEVRYQPKGGATFNQRVFVGRVPTDETSGTLLAISSCRSGKTGLEPSMFLYTYRLGTVSLKAVIELEFVPANANGSDGDVHMLATEPDGSQKYHVMGLRSQQMTRSESFPERKVRFLKSETTGNIEVEIKQ